MPASSCYLQQPFFVREPQSAQSVTLCSKAYMYDHSVKCIFLDCSGIVMDVQATVPVLWLMPALQLLLLLFFTTVAVSHWIYSLGLLLPCFMTGTLPSSSCSLLRVLVRFPPPPTAFLLPLFSFMLLFPISFLLQKMAWFYTARSCSSAELCVEA